MYHFGLIGHPIDHSLSREWMQQRFVQMHLDADYSLIDLQEIADFPALLGKQKWNGFNVTIPHKRAIIPYLDSLSPTAAAIGAVNTIRITPEKQLIGDNTDAIGFRTTLLPHLQTGCQYQALVLGTGGASRAVEYVLNTLGIRHIFVSRQTPQSATTQDNLQQKRKIIGYDMLTYEIIREHHLIINTTPLGMYPDIGTMPAIPYNAMTSEHILYDLVYNPLETKFLQQAKAHNAKAVTGIDMLHAQADASLNIWLHGNSL